MTASLRSCWNAAWWLIVLALDRLAVGEAGIGFVGQNALSFGALDHGFELRAFGLVGRGGVDAVSYSLFVGTGETLVAESAFGPRGAFPRHHRRPLRL